MTDIDQLIGSALKEHRNTLSEWESASLLKDFGIPMAKGILARDWDEVRRAAEGIGYPVVLKICAPEVSHKTESGLVAVDLRTEADLETAFKRIGSARETLRDGACLVQEMVKGGRELVAGMIRDPQFGPCVMFGLGGILTEILGDVTFRPAPLSASDAREMIGEIKGHKILGAIRGMPAVDVDALAACLVSMGRIGLECEEIQAIDVNPLIIQDSGQGSKPVAVDALVILKGQ